MNGMRTFGASLKRLREPPFVEGVDGVAHGLGVAREASGDLVGILAPVASEQDLTPTEDESIGGTQPRFEGFAFGVAQGTHEDRSFHDPQDKPSTTVSSGHALAEKRRPEGPERAEMIRRFGEWEKWEHEGI